ncbi:hypothetical protein ACWA7J_09475 [Leptothrix sp. BB-4]
MAHASRPHALLICHAGLIGLLLGAATGVRAELAGSQDVVVDAGPAMSSNAAGWRMHLGPPHRRGIEVGTLLSADAGQERLYAYVDLQDRLPLPVRRVLRQADGGITVERGPGASANPLATPPGPPARTSLGSMLRWQMSGGTQMALRLRAGRLGLQLTVPFSP